MNAPLVAPASPFPSVTRIGAPRLSIAPGAPVVDETSWLLGPPGPGGRSKRAEALGCGALQALQAPAVVAAGGVMGGAIGLVWGGLLTGQVATLLSGDDGSDCCYAPLYRGICRGVVMAATLIGGSVSCAIDAGHDLRGATLEAAALAGTSGLFAAIAGGWVGIAGAWLLTCAPNGHDGPRTPAAQLGFALLSAGALATCTTRATYRALKPNPQEPTQNPKGSDPFGFSEGEGAVADAGWDGCLGA